MRSIGLGHPSRLLGGRDRRGGTGPGRRPDRHRTGRDRGARRRAPARRHRHPRGDRQRARDRADPGAARPGRARQPQGDQGGDAARTMPSPGRSSSAPSSARSSFAPALPAPGAGPWASPRPRPSASSSESLPPKRRWPTSASSPTGFQAGSRCGSRKRGAHLTTLCVNQRGRDQPRPCASVRRVSRTTPTMRLAPGHGKTGLDLHPSKSRNTGRSEILSAVSRNGRA